MPEVGQPVADACNIINLRCFPLIADSGTPSPYAIYRRTSQDITTSKDGVVDLNAQYEIIIVAQNYAQSVSLLHQLIDALRITYAQEHEDYIVDEIRFEDGGEDYTENCFLQNLTLSINYNLK